MMRASRLVFRSCTGLHLALNGNYEIIVFLDKALHGREQQTPQSPHPDSSRLRRGS